MKIKTVFVLLTLLPFVLLIVACPKAPTDPTSTTTPSKPNPPTSTSDSGSPYNLSVTSASSSLGSTFSDGDTISLTYTIKNTGSAALTNLTNSHYLIGTLSPVSTFAQLTNVFVAANYFGLDAMNLAVNASSNYSLNFPIGTMGNAGSNYYFYVFVGPNYVESSLDDDFKLVGQAQKVANPNTWYLETYANQNTGEQGDSYLELYNSTGTTLLAQDDDAGDGAYSKIATNLASGTYLLKLRGFSGSDAFSYSLAVYKGISRPAGNGSNGTKTTADSYEPNNTSATATLISTNTAIFGSLTAGESDWFQITIP